MRVPLCDWQPCEQPAELVVLVGEDAGVAVRQGAYCPPHATISRRALAGGTGEPAWFGPLPPIYPPLRLVGDGAGDRPLYRHVCCRAPGAPLV